MTAEGEPPEQTATSVRERIGINKPVTMTGAVKRARVPPVCWPPTPCEFGRVC
jgi:hypothetical protein